MEKKASILYILKYIKIHLPNKINGRNWMHFPIIAASMKYQNLSLFWRRATVIMSGIVGAKPMIAKRNKVH